jgi:hypothetical protein
VKRLDHLFFQVILFFILFSGCMDKNNGEFFRKLDPSQTGVDFVNLIFESDSVNVVSFTNIYNGGGVGVADFNRDGLPDLFFTGNMVSSKLYLNRTIEGRIQFEDVSRKANIHTGRWATGVSIADINEDGWPDIYVCVSGSKIRSKRQNYLFIHQGLDENRIPVFQEMAKEYGLADQTYSTQSAFLDYDLDGDLDLFVAVNFADQFYGATVNIPTPNKKGYTDRSDRLYQNTGTGEDGYPVFKDVSVEAGILHEGYTLGLVVQDINLDGWPDIYESDDFLSNDIYYENQGDGTFDNRIGEYFKHTTFAGMGMDISDFNNDGRPDIFVLDMTPADNLRQKSMMIPVRSERFAMNLKSGYYPQYNRNTLQLNNGINPAGKLSFSEIGQLAGVHHTDWSWTVLFGDLNNNGYRDLMVCNGFRRDLQDLDNVHYLFGDNPFGTRKHWEKQFVEKVKEIPGIYVSNYLLENNGDLTFTDRSVKWGFHHPSYSNGGVMTDLDNDGDLDIVINNLDEPPFIYENTVIGSSMKSHQKHHYLKIQFSDQLLNAKNIGTKITLYHGSQIQHHQHYVVRGYLSSLDPVVHFGLGGDTLVNEIRIEWPDGVCKTFENVSVDQLLTIHKEITTCGPGKNIDRADPLFENVSAEVGFPLKHKELDFDDFIFQPLLLQKHSRNGPGMAVGDVNGDHLEDLVVGGAKGQSSSILIQQPDGGFIGREIPGTEFMEILGVLLFDADQDGDLDLYAVSGGSENIRNDTIYQDRLFVNQGKGTFELDSKALPVMRSSGSCVLASDFDRDGDPDLFVGGRVIPREFPGTPESYLLRNDSGTKRIRFTDVTDIRGPQIRNAGMVSGGLFTDFNNDQHIDLILAGEWMPLKFYENTGSVFQLIEGETGLEFSNGWWNSIYGADFDKDGDTDYIAGNLGLNSWLKADRKEPLSLYAGDFDKNGKIDPLIFYYVKGKNVPFHPRSLLVMQLNYLDRKFPTYRDFATAGLNDVLDKTQQEEAMKKYVYEFRSSYIENLGHNRFRINPLPEITQSAPIYGILVDDFDDDGNFDALLTGNSKASNLTLGWYDASIGYMLKGKGDGTFQVIDGVTSHFYTDKDAKSIIQMKYGDDGTIVVVANTNDSLAVFSRKHLPAYQVNIPETADYGTIFYRDLSRQKIEFYRGAGYLSSQGSTFFVGSQVERIEFYGANRDLVQEVSFD